MNYFKLAVALLAGASVASAAAGLRTDSNGDCDFYEAEELRLHQIIQAGDNPAALAAMIKGCRKVFFNAYLESGLTEMIRQHRQALFRFIVPHVEFEAWPHTRNELLQGFLMQALRSNNFDAADYLAGLEIQVQPRVEGGSAWGACEAGNYNVQGLKDFFTKHRGVAEALSPTHGDMQFVASEADVRALVKVAQHCDNLNGQRSFNPTRFLVHLLKTNRSMGNAELARAVFRLIQYGAPYEDADVQYWLQRRPEIFRLVHAMMTKEPV